MLQKQLGQVGGVRLSIHVGMFLTALAWTHVAIAVDCSLLPDACKTADSINTQVGTTTDQLGSQAESSVGSLVTDVSNGASNTLDAAGEQLLPTANVAAQTAWQDAKAELSVQQQPIATRAAATSTSTAASSITSSSMRLNEQDIQRLRLAAAQLEEKARKLDGLDARAKAYLDAELASIKQKTDEMVLSLRRKLQGQLNQWFAEAQSSPSDLLNVSTVQDIATDVGSDSDTGRQSDAGQYDDASLSMALYGINGGMVLPLSFRATPHIDFSIAMPIEKSRVDRLLGQIRLLTDLWWQANIEGYLQTNFNDENNVRVGTKIRQVIWRIAFTGDISWGWMSQEFTFVRQRLGTTFDLPWRQTLYVAYNGATFRHRELASVITSNEIQFGYRYVTPQYHWAPTGVELSVIAISPQQIVWKFDQQSTRLNSHGWNFGFGVGSRF